MKELFAVASLLLSVTANIPYVYETIKGQVKPERISWLLWTMLGFTYYFSALFEGAATYFTFGELVGPVTILILSIKYGVGGKSKFDIYSLIVALVAFGLLLIVQNVLLSLLLALFVDMIGITLTVRKLLIDPASESKSFWALAASASIFALLSLKTYNAETLLFPVYVLIISIVIFWLTDPQKSKNINKIEKL
jgi:hypothetical protein